VEGTAQHAGVQRVADLDLLVGCNEALGHLVVDALVKDLWRE
jgi:hypothetical protein